jgi:hypothetical protein
LVERFLIEGDGIFHMVLQHSSRTEDVDEVYNRFVAHKNSLEALRQQLPLLAERYGVETLEVFGAYVRAEQKADSDLDLLVTFREAPSLLTFIAIENYLSDSLGVKVDLVMKDSLKPAIEKAILSEAMSV